jgi:hypothetical protein
MFTILPCQSNDGGCALFKFSHFTQVIDAKETLLKQSYDIVLRKLLFASCARLGLSPEL